MSFHLIVKGPVTNRMFTWSVQDKKPEPLQYEDPFSVLYFQADGHELEEIKRQFPNLPYHNMISKWKGETAQFIYDNLM